MATKLANGRDGDRSPYGAAHGRKHGRPRPLSCHALGGGYRARLGHRPTQHLALRHVRGRSSGRPRRSPADRITGAASLSPDRDARTAFRNRAATLAGGERHQQPQGCGSPLHRGCARRSLDRARRRRRVPPACREMRHRSKPPWISESPARTVDRCAPQHLASELNVIKPLVVVTMGLMAYRALVRALETSSSPLHPPARLPLTEPPLVASTDGVLVDQASHSFRLFASPFIRTPRLRTIAAAILTRAASAAGIRSDA